MTIASCAVGISSGSTVGGSGGTLRSRVHGSEAF